MLSTIHRSRKCRANPRRSSQWAPAEIIRTDDGYFDCGACGPEGAVGAGFGADGSRSPGREPPPPSTGVPAWLKIDVGVPRLLATSVSDRLVAKKAAASTAVVLVSALPALRPVMNPPPPPPMPS